MKNKYLLPFFLFIFSSTSLADLRTNYINEPLYTMVDTVTRLTGRNFTFNSESSNVPISLTMSKQMTAQQVYILFVQSLRVAGLKAVETMPGIISIVPVSQVVDPAYRNSDHLETVVLNVDNIEAEEVTNALQNSVSAGGFISPAGDNKIVLRDSPLNIEGLEGVIHKLDKRSLDPRVYKTLSLNNVTPSTIVGNDQIIVTPYDDHNRVVLYGKKSQVKQFTESLLSLDESFKTVYTRLLITSSTSSFSDEFNLSAIFQSGALSVSLRSIKANSIEPFTDGISAVLSLFNEKSDIQILSKPFMQLREGKKASFNVGREIPIVISQIDQESGQRINNIERKKVGLSVELLAKVRPDGLIDLDLYQNLSSISETQLENASDLITDDQSIKTSLLIEPGKVYAVGGVTDKRSVLTESGIDFLPFLDSDNQSDQSQEITIFIETSLKPFNS